MKWKDKLAASLASAKEIMVGSLKKLGLGDVDAVGAVDQLTDALEAPLAVWLAARGLPPALAKSAAQAALNQIDAAVAGMLAAKGK